MKRLEKLAIQPRRALAVSAGLFLIAGIVHAAETAAPAAAVSNHTGKAVSAAPAPHTKPSSPLKAAAAELALNEEQRTESARILQKRLEQIRKITCAAGLARRAVFEAVQAEPFDEAAIRKAAQEAAKCEEELAVIRGLIASELRAILTPEQKKALQKSIRDIADTLQRRAENTGSLVDAWVEENKP